MQSAALTVEAYIAEAPEARRGALARLRDLCRETLPGAEERIAYGMPAYYRGDTLLVAFASQKHHLSIYGCHGAADAHADKLSGVDRGKGCFRYRKPEVIDFALWRTILGDLAARYGSIS